MKRYKFSISKIYLIIVVLLIVSVPVLFRSRVIEMLLYNASQQPQSFSLRIEKEFDLPTPGAAVAVTWASDGSALAAASDYGGTITVWDSSGRQISQIKRIGGGPALGGSIAFINGSSQLAFVPPQDSNDDASICIWDVATGKIVKTLAGPEPGEAYSRNRGNHFMVSPDGSILAIATRGGKGSPNFRANAIIYDTRNWQILQFAKIDEGVFSLSFFNHGRLIVIGSNLGQITVLSAITAVKLHEYNTFDEIGFGDLFIGAVAGSPDGELLFAGAGQASSDVSSAGDTAAGIRMNSVGTARTIRVQDGKTMASLGEATSPIRQAAWDPVGRYVAFIDNSRGLFLWRPEVSGSYKKIILPSATFSLAISPNGSRIAVTTDGGVRLFSVK
jgi:WD40 repeat protein